MVEACTARLVPVVGLPVTRQRHEPGGAATIARAQPPRHLVTVHLRQAYVDERDVGLQALGRFERRTRAIRRRDLVPFELEQQRERVGRVGAVVDDENAASAASGPSGGGVACRAALRCAANG